MLVLPYLDMAGRNPPRDNPADGAPMAPGPLGVKAQGDFHTPIGRRSYALKTQRRLAHDITSFQRTLPHSCHAATPRYTAAGVR